MIEFIAGAWAYTKAKKWLKKKKDEYFPAPGNEPTAVERAEKAEAQVRELRAALDLLARENARMSRLAWLEAVALAAVVVWLVALLQR